MQAHPKDKHRDSKQILASVQDAYNTFAQEWNTVRQHDWKEFNLLDDLIPAGARVLDLGCGNGRLCGYLHNMSSRVVPYRGAEATAKVPSRDVSRGYTGVDNSKELIKIAKQNYPDAQFVLGDALHLPFDDASFDFVVSFAVLHHIPRSHHDQFFAEIARVLAPGGSAFITVWNMFQPRYRRFISPNILRRLFPKRNVYIPFGQHKIPRYVYAFTPFELCRVARKFFKVEEKSNTEGNICVWLRLGKRKGI